MGKQGKGKKKRGGGANKKKDNRPVVGTVVDEDGST